MHDVVIAGAGPNGLLLACELALGGVRPLVLEAATERPSRPKANAIVGQVVSALDYRGLYARIAGHDRAPQQVARFFFGAVDFDLHDVPDAGFHIAAIPQARLEELLAERAAELGVRVLRGHRVTGLDQDAHRVTLTVAGPDGPYECTARYAVAADGGRSTIRKALGIPFPGEYDDSFVSRSGIVLAEPEHVTADGALHAGGNKPYALGLARSEGGSSAIPGRTPITPGFTRTETGVFGYLPLPGGQYRVVVHTWGERGLGETDELSIVELNEAVHRVLGVRIPFRYTENAVLRTRHVGAQSRQAERYRDGRVFLAGDAAHVHSGIGGPGLNLGMQDVLNLGWKLAAVLRGTAPEALLDTYHAERHPVGLRVLLHSRAQLVLLAPGPNVTALREVFGELLRDDSAVRRIAGLLSGAEVRYPAPAGAHPLTGTWLPDLPLHTANGPGRVAELMRAARPVLLLFDAPPAALDGWQDRVDVLRVSTPEAPAPAVLVRPDGFVAWAGVPDDALYSALRTWFGEPAASLSTVDSA